MFDFDGFFQPVDNLPAVNQAQPGKAIPPKFSLGGGHGLDFFEPGYPQSHQVACATGAVLDSIEETASPGASELTYSRGEDRYHYVWKTEKGWKGQCRELVVRFVYGTRPPRCSASSSPAHRLGVTAPRPRPGSRFALREG